MRKLCLLLGMLVLLGGCSSLNDSEPEIKREEIPDPLVEVEGTQAFARVGADIEAPVGAENARYYIISERIAEIQFSQNGVEYCYRASQDEESGENSQENAREQESVQAVVGDVSIPIQTQGDRHLAVWRWGSMCYRLESDDPVDEGIMKALVEELERETMPAQI